MEAAAQDKMFCWWGFGEFSDPDRPPCDAPEMHPATLWDPARGARERLGIAWARASHPWSGWYELAHVAVCQLPVVVDILGADPDEETVELVALFLRLRIYRYRTVRVPGCGQADVVPSWRHAVARLADQLPAEAGAHLLGCVGDLPPDDWWFAAHLSEL